MPSEYVAHSKSWMTSDIFNKWLQKLDGMFATQRRNVALIVDNCPAHKCTIALSSIELFVLPPNSTPLIQPMDAVIIRSFKANFRNELVRRRIDYFEAKKKFRFNLLDALYLVRRSCKIVSHTTVLNGFKKAFELTTPEMQDDDADTDLQIVFEPFN